MATIGWAVRNARELLTDESLAGLTHVAIGVDRGTEYYVQPYREDGNGGQVAETAIYGENGLSAFYDSQFKEACSSPDTVTVSVWPIEGATSDRIQFHVHATDCSEQGDVEYVNVSAQNMIVASKEEVVTAIYDTDDYGWNPRTIDDYDHYRRTILFFPCTKTLPEREEA